MQSVSSYLVSIVWKLKVIADYMYMLTIVLLNEYIAGILNCAFLHFIVF